MDFTVDTYCKLIETLKKNNFSFSTFEQFVLNRNKKEHEKTVILRHDVDKKPINALKIAEIEAELEVKATYYFRIVPESNVPEVIKKIVDLGHEIGYHYEELAVFEGNYEKAFDEFIKNLTYFRTYYPVTTICMHGSPMGKFDNKKIWDKYDYKKFGIIGEPYFDFPKTDVSTKIVYLTDTGRKWNSKKSNMRDEMKNTYSDNAILNIRSTFDFINWINNSKTNFDLMLTTHPQRWTDNRLDWITELLTQNVKNIVKTVIKQQHI